MESLIHSLIDWFSLPRNGLGLCTSDGVAGVLLPQARREDHAIHASIRCEERTAGVAGDDRATEGVHVAHDT